MTANPRRIVLTGFGVLTSIGKDTASFWEGLRQGRSGVRPVRAFDTSGLPVRFAGEIPDFNARDYLEKKDRKSLVMMARGMQMAVAGAQLALVDGAVEKSRLDPTRFGVNFGSGLLPTELEEVADASRVSANCRPGAVDLEKWGEQGIATIPPKWMLKYLPNMLACHVSILHNAQGPNNTLTAQDVASLLALGEAYRILGRDAADFFLVGGAESKIHPLSIVRQCLFESLSTNNDAPEKACRPFDRRRDGLVMGEGAGVVVMEELEHARRRGATIRAEVVGYAAGFDRGRTGAGLARVIRQAMTEAGITPADVDHVNAHGLSTPAADRWEAKAVREVFGDVAVPVFAAKSYVGNLGAGGGTTELIASALALQHGEVPVTLNYEEPDPECPVNVVAKAPRPVERDYVVKVGFTQLGQCAAVVLRRWRGE